MCLKCESTFRRFQLGEGPSRGPLQDCENIAEGWLPADLVRVVSLMESSRQTAVLLTTPAHQRHASEA